MRPSIGGLVAAVALPLAAALGGAFVVFSEIDDAPGGVLIGLVLIVGAAALNVRAARRGATP